MDQDLRLLCVLAHPDDESMGAGGILAACHQQGLTTGVVTATRGECGWMGVEEGYPGPVALGRVREQELRCAAEKLGVKHLEFLDYIDGELDLADPLEASSKVAAAIRRFKPHVVITFGMEGAYGHPDHIAISQFTTAGVTLAADSAFATPGGLPPHRVSKLYYMVDPPGLVDTLEELGVVIDFQVDGVQRNFICWPEWVITTRVDVSAHWRTVWDAIRCHISQLDMFGDMERITPEQHRRLWGQANFYRVFSLVNGGHAVEDDIFAGLR